MGQPIARIVVVRNLADFDNGSLGCYNLADIGFGEAVSITLLLVDIGAVAEEEGMLDRRLCFLYRFLA